MNKSLSLIFLFLSCMHINILPASEPQRPTTPIKPSHLTNSTLWFTAFDIGDTETLNYYTEQKNLYDERMKKYEEEIKKYNNFVRHVTTAQLIKKYNLPKDTIQEILQYLSKK